MATKKSVPPTLPPDLTKTTDGGDAVVLERRAQRVQPPQMYQVVMLNDDFTPMEFVVIVLKIHLDGKGVCGVYTRDVAHTKVDQVLDAARQNGHPLQCVAEPIE